MRNSTTDHHVDGSLGVTNGNSEDDGRSSDEDWMLDPDSDDEGEEDTDDSSDGPMSQEGEGKS